MATTSSSPTRRIIPPSLAWLAVFLPALSYFLATRMNQAGFSLGKSSFLGQPIENTVELLDNDDITAAITTDACDALAECLYLSKSCSSSDTNKGLSNLLLLELELKYPLSLVQESGLRDIVASSWRHDSELGRGYLLLSEAAASGRIWRWEVGGGPIAIGKTLYLENAGCRSNNYKQCQNTTTRRNEEEEPTGSGGIAIDFYKKDHFTEGRLVVAEWGEGRIARLEENGARTPLLMHVPDVCATTDSEIGAPRRLQRPKTLLYTPFGDLLVIDYYDDCRRTVLLQLRYAVHVEALSSLVDSRKAHSWESIPDSTSSAQLPQLLYQGHGIDSIGGMSMTPEWTSVYLTSKKDESIVLLKIPLASDDEDETTTEDSPPSTATKPQVVFNVSEHIPSVNEPGCIAVDRKGRLYLSVSDGVLIVDVAKGIVLGKLKTPARPTSLTLGEDGFLYITTRTSLLRLPVREGPVKLPTNVVVRPLANKATHS